METENVHAMQKGRSEKNGLALSKSNSVGESCIVVQQMSAESTLFTLLTGLTFHTWLVQVRSYMFKSSILYRFHHKRNTLR